MTAPDTRQAADSKCTGSGRGVAPTVARGQWVVCTVCGRTVRAQLNTAGCAIPPHYSTVVVNTTRKD